MKARIVIVALMLFVPFIAALHADYDDDDFLVYLPVVMGGSGTAQPTATPPTPTPAMPTPTTTPTPWPTPG